MRIVVLSATLLLGGPLPSQAFSSPIGLLKREGGTNAGTFGHFDIRHIQIDIGREGAGTRAIRRIAFRRDGKRASPTATGHAVDVTIRMGHGDFRRLPLSGDVAATSFYRTAPIVVFSKKRVNVPDWSRLVGQPAPFDFVLPLDRVFAYDDRFALVWDVTSENASRSVAPKADAHGPDPANVTGGFYTSTEGCRPLAGGGQHRTRSYFFSFGPLHPSHPMLMRISVYDSTPFRPVLVGFDLSGRFVRPPGFCARIIANPVFMFILGNADARGWLRNKYVSAPWVQAIVGRSLSMQSFAASPGRTGVQVTVSTVRAVIVPGAPAAPPVRTATVSMRPHLTSGTIRHGFGLVARFD